MENEFDDVADDLADLNDVDWDLVLPVAPHLDYSHLPDTYLEPASPESSVYDLPDVLYDPATLAQIDELEQQALNREREPPQLGAHIICLYTIYSLVFCRMTFFTLATVNQRQYAFVLEV